MCEDTDCPTWTNVKDCADSDLVCTVESTQVSLLDVLSDSMRENPPSTWTNVQDCVDSGLVCTVETTQASCVDPAGGTGGSGGTGGTGGTAGSGGTAGTGGTGGGASSCAERDIPDLPQLAGTLVTFPSIVTFDECLNVRASVDADTREVAAFITNVNSGFFGGSGVALTAGDETVEICVRVETVADPGPHVLELELWADPSNRLNRVGYTPGDGDTYVRTEYENDVPGPETATTCLERNVTVQFP